MKSTIKYRMMLDASRSGVSLGHENAPDGMSIEVRKDEIGRIKKIMKAANAVALNLEQAIYVPPPAGGSSGMNLVLRRNKDDEEKNAKFYLNLDGNPTTFFNANNDYGSPDTMQIVHAFRYVLRIVQDSIGIKFPKRIRESVRDGDIALNSLEFAIYTCPMRNPLGLIRAWKWVYTMPSMGNDYTPRVLSDRLPGVRYVNTEFWDEFRIWTQRANSSPDRMFCAYYKAKEIEEVQGRAAPADLDGRIRIDLGLKYRWFADRRIKNLMDFDAYLKKKGGIRSVLETEVSEVMDRCQLQYMFQIDFDESEWDLTRCNADTHKHMVLARKEMSIPQNTKWELLKNGSGDEYVKLYKNERRIIMEDALSLELDTSKVKDHD